VTLVLLGFFVNLLMPRHWPAFALFEKGTGLCPVDARR
jgi:hypothetical protein